MQPDKERIAAAAAIIASRCSPNWREFDNAEWIARAVLTESDRVEGRTMLPDFRIPIDDKDAAEWWLDEWMVRWYHTKDHAFKEAAEAMKAYIEREFDEAVEGQD